MGGILGGSAPYIQPDTLRSSATMIVVDILSEGPVQGLVAGMESVFFDDTPVYDAISGLFYFNGVVISVRPGTVDQYLVQNPTRLSAEEFDYNQKVSSTAPQYYTLDNPDLSSIDVLLNLTSLSQTDTKGNVNSTSCNFNIDVRYEGGTWHSAYIPIYGKISSQYQRTVSLPLPKNPLVPASEQGPWDIRVTKYTPDGELPVWGNSIVSNDLYVQSIVGYVNLPLYYPYTAIAQTTLDATFFGASVPVRSYEIYGLIVSVPTNYDPWGRVYNGIWDGTFYQSWTNNPAWVLYDLITNDRYGLGAYVDIAQVDKWSFYEIAQYCDELVPNGLGGMELRFSFNGVISSSREAFDTLSAIASVFRGMTYWSSGAVMVSQDKVKDPVMLVTPANVIDGNFSYKSSAIKARHTAVMVKWNDPLQHYKENWEAVEDNVGISRYGYRQTTIEAVGCTSRGQARRFGLWTLLTELINTETLTYSAGLDHAVVMPGDIIQVQDPTTGAADFGGRLRAGCTTLTLILDRLVGIDPTASYVVHVLNADGSVYEGAVSAFLQQEATADTTAPASGAMQNVDAEPPELSARDINSMPHSGARADRGSGVPASDTQLITADEDSAPIYSILQLVTPMNVAPPASAIWVLQEVNTEPQLFQVVGKKETAANVYEISAIEHTPELFAAVDAEFFFDPQDVAPTTAPAPVLNLTVVEEDYYNVNGYFAAAFLSWQAPAYSGPLTFHITAVGPKGFVDYGTTTATNLTIQQLDPGKYTFNVQAVASQTFFSPYVSVNITIAGWAAVPAPGVTGLSLNDTTGDNISVTPQQFGAPSPTISWTNTFPAGVTSYPCNNVVRVYHTATNTLLRTVTVTNTAGETRGSYTYTEDLNRADGGPFRDLTFSVTALSPNNVEGASTTLATINPPPQRATNVQVSVAGSVVNVTFTINPADTVDVAGVRIFVSSNNVQVGSPPTAPYVYDGTSYPASFIYGPGVFYLSVGLYDTFGTSGMKATTPIPFSVSSNFSVVSVLLAGDSADLGTASSAFVGSDDFSTEQSTPKTVIDLGFAHDTVPQS